MECNYDSDFWYMTYTDNPYRYVKTFTSNKVSDEYKNVIEIQKRS